MNAVAPHGGVYLANYLEPLAPYLERSDVTDLFINCPCIIWVETLGGKIESHSVPELTTASLDRLARQIAAMSHQGINRENPLLSAVLPDGARVQIVAPPATRGALAIAIRKHVSIALSLDDYASSAHLAALSRILERISPRSAASIWTRRSGKSPQQIAISLSRCRREMAATGVIVSRRDAT